ncbi:hypothetical protein H3146_07365 [Streptomyces sp. OF3]|uniref:DUF1349 domain-containing protein n=1 Tax=Streptomyces alkaliterrae TaxID=2213162 RepID=A0A7W3WIW2_9ACTN|nr:hypothetical protein [Streptomyces alkaliterrae]MBB1253189.1 hypothetical protein [Streptomyces alkaliterrae]
MLFTELVDNFNDGIISAVWGNAYGGVSEVGGKARVPCTTGFAGYQTANSWTLAESSVYVQLTTPPSGAGSTVAYCGVMVNSATPGIRAGFLLDAASGQLRMAAETDYWDPTGTEITYSPTTHLWLRIRETGGTLYWDTSPDGTTWTNRRNIAAPAWIAADVDQCALDLFAHRDDGTDDYAEYDNVNTLSDAGVQFGDASLVAAATLNTAAIVSARTAARLDGDSALTAHTTLAARARAVLAAAATLHARTASTDIPEVAELAAGDWDLYIEQGATFVQTYTVDDPDFSWDGWSVRAQIRSVARPDAQLLLDLTPYLTVEGAAIRLAIPAAVTETLTRNGRWDLEVYQGSTVVRLLNGRAIVSPEVTQ